MTSRLVTNDLAGAMALAADRIEAAIDRLIPEVNLVEARLFEAMRHGTLGGGKRLRPFLVLESASLFGVHPDCALRVAVAVELVHGYSLIHDDLPAMDDADTRRGRPSVHRAFDEATAILAGDGLLTRCFEVLTDPTTHGDPGVRAELARACAVAAGAAGMVGGQMIDLQAAELELDHAGIVRLQRMKTGALIAFAAEAGAILGRAAPQLRHALGAYAHDLGLAFQIADDLLDLEGDPAETGKATAKDAAAGKATLVGVLGPERARAQAELLAAQACRHLDPFDGRADLLKDLARFVVARRR